MTAQDYSGPDRRRGGPDRRALDEVTRILVVDDHALFRMGIANILGREPDSAGRAYFITIAAAYGRGMVAGVLAQSPENRRAEVGFAIDNYLGRPAATPEVDYFVAALQNGMRREEVDVQIVGSAEYYNNT